MKTVAIINRQNPSIDFQLYTRPFRNQSWYLIGVVFAIFAIILIGYRWHEDTCSDWSSLKLTIFVGSSFNLMLNAYYGGALTMFFTTKQELPFESFRDVLKAIPEWTMIVEDGYTSNFQTQAHQVRI